MVKKNRYFFNFKHLIQVYVHIFNIYLSKQKDMVCLTSYDYKVDPNL